LGRIARLRLARLWLARLWLAGAAGMGRVSRLWLE
jgi:hypothetical protein